MEAMDTTNTLTISSALELLREKKISCSRTGRSLLPSNRATQPEAERVYHRH